MFWNLASKYVFKYFEINISLKLWEETHLDEWRDAWQRPHWRARFECAAVTLLDDTRGERSSGRARIMLFLRHRAARSFIFKKDRNDRALNDRRGAFSAPAGNS
jgi:hypothetical protein